MWCWSRTATSTRCNGWWTSTVKSHGICGGPTCSTPILEAPGPYSLSPLRFSSSSWLSCRLFMQCFNTTRVTRLLLLLHLLHPRSDHALVSLIIIAQSFLFYFLGYILLIIWSRWVRFDVTTLFNCSFIFAFGWFWLSVKKMKKMKILLLFCFVCLLAACI